MASAGSSNGGGRSSGALNKVGALLLGVLGIGGLIIFLGGGGGDDGPNDGPVATAAPAQAVVAATAPAPTQRPSTTQAQPAGFDKNSLRLGDPNNVVLTVTAFGLPPRVGLQAVNPADSRSNGSFDPGRGTSAACLPDQQYPNPCVYYIVVPRGASVTVTAGNSRAGFWPILESLAGGGCDRPGDPGDRDVTCTLSVFQDADIVARYYGDTTASGRYAYPKCPVPSDRGPAAPAPTSWINRCQ